MHRALGANLPLGEPIRLSRFHFQARHAERYRDGRILLAGDAAHLFPAGGEALNAGLLDAVNLAWKLAAAIRCHDITVLTLQVALSGWFGAPMET
ncbi:hypothetical protein ABH37_10855 [Mycobacterium haemophilum]|uniref:FAD-binding domain-containing protein n=2 Tax=Mycobacterium haemophilum TaxID=29311 RepID=A0A0I9XXR0_9MYCO|nr:hypothetical protein ABH39_08305 [Mycobacterium haemophilum]KLO36329.1 hypothetical protein ABH38_12225 [Mycobacterium haemophilum]KLO42213.1 hypothetical protein ABH37_10855 [Mycobacterium haemophilum]KLO50015.1 hypothetical protein ABH36_08775 [Mycobacterium haemophilum]